MEDENTRYVKGSSRVVPAKTNHKHEYIRVFTNTRIRLHNGLVTEKKYRFQLPDRCVVCGHTSRKRRQAVEIEVSPEEYRYLRG